MKIKIEKISKEEAEKRGIGDWAKWECAPSEFPWEYDCDESCYIFEGKVKVTTDEGEEVEIGAGDMVTFPKGLKCRWKVIEKVKKVFNFD